MADISEAVSLASRDAVVAAAARLGVANPTYSFLDLPSPLLGNIEVLIENTTTIAGVNRLAEYLALACSYHLLEGWRYLGKAGYALLNGSSGASVHLAYYAELRAARSLLAANGIYVGNKRHFAIDVNRNLIPIDRVSSNPQPASFRDRIREQWNAILVDLLQRSGGTRLLRVEQPPGTHIAAWAILKAWSLHGANALQVMQGFDGLRYKGIDWRNVCASVSNRADIAEQWLQNWSADLKLFAHDQLLRNLASYGVDLTAEAFAPLTEAECDLIVEANEACRFVDNGKVDSLDLAILHDFCVKSVGPVLNANTPNDRRIWDRVRAGLENKENLSVEESRDVVDIMRSSWNSHPGRILQRAKHSNHGPDGVFSRALLLLKLATAVHRQLWRDIRMIAPHGKVPWQAELLRQYADNSHLADNSNRPASYEDFQIDTVDELTDLTTWRQKNLPFSAFAVWEAKRDTLTRLCRFERVALWESEI